MSEIYFRRYADVKPEKSERLLVMFKYFSGHTACDFYQYDKTKGLIAGFEIEFKKHEFDLFWMYARELRGIRCEKLT